MKRAYAPRPKKLKEREEPESRAPAVQDHEKLDADMDDLRAEIDSVLEANAEEFVKPYVQKGGE